MYLVSAMFARSEPRNINMARLFTRLQSTIKFIRVQVRYFNIYFYTPNHLNVSFLYIKVLAVDTSLNCNIIYKTNVFIYFFG